MMAESKFEISDLIHMKSEPPLLRKFSDLELLKLLETPLKVDYKVHEYREIGILSYILFNKMFFST